MKDSQRALAASTAVKCLDGVSETIAPVQQGQILILDGFPTPRQVAVLGPNSGTTNRYGLSRLRQEVQGWVKVAADHQGILRVPPPVRVTLRYVVPDSRHRDADNFAVIAKPVIDGLVRAGILAGDDNARLTLRVEFVKERGGRWLEVVLEEVTP